MHVDLTYDHLTRHIVPGPQSLTYFVSLILLPIALLTARSILPRWQNALLFLPIMVSTTIQAWRKMGGVDVISVDVLLWALFLLALRDPWKEFRRVRGTIMTNGRGSNAHKVQTGLPAVAENGDLQGQTAVQPSHNANSSKIATEKSEELGYPSDFLERLQWVGTLLVSIRLNNWKINSPSHDRTQPTPPAFRNRLAFLRHSLLCFVRGYLVLDLSRAYVSYDPYFTDLTVSITSPLPLSGLSYIPPQVVRTMVIGAQAWALISQMFYLPCLLPVSLNFLGVLPDEWSPHNWPPYFGSPEAIFLHGVRGFWGQYWHQTMRWSVAGPGYALADALGLTSGALLRYAIISMAAFGFSGVVHMGLIPPEPLHSRISANAIRLCVAEFFWLQPIAMMVEVLVAKLVANAMGPRYWQQNGGLKLRMAVHAVWVIAWFTLTLPLLGEAGRNLGYWRVWVVPVSLWKGIRGEGWVAWPFLLS